MPQKTLADAATKETKTHSVAPPGGTERRREQRIPCDAIPARIRIDDSLKFVAGRILDVSTFGLQVRADSPLAVGSDVTVYFNTTVAAGQVRYCRPNQDGSFNAGLQLSDVLNLV